MYFGEPGYSDGADEQLLDAAYSSIALFRASINLQICIERKEAVFHVGFLAEVGS